MFEKVNPKHPDKVADRIAGAIVDLAYIKEENPRVAVEVLIGHGLCTIIGEISVNITLKEVKSIVYRIVETKKIKIKLLLVPQDKHLAENQNGKIRCGDNGIFKGVPTTKEQQKLTNIAYDIYCKYKYDGKYILNGSKLIICQSNAMNKELKKLHPNATINPLGEWSGGIDVDTGATNRKLGSDMGDGVTGGGLSGKELSKADVTVNIYAHLKAQETGKVVKLYCAIGDEFVDGKPYSDIVKIARSYINEVGGFERFAEWGLIRPTNERC